MAAPKCKWCSAGAVFNGECNYHYFTGPSSLAWKRRLSESEVSE